MNVALVTGGAGFIGSHVAKKLIAHGYETVVFDDLSTGRKDAIPRGARFVKGDVRNKEALLRTFQKFKPQVVCHVAGRASNIGSYMDPIGDIEVNYLGSVRIVAACMKYGVKRLVYASSMLADGPGGPSSYYGVSKYAAERFIHLTGIRPDIAKPLSVTSLRMFNVYGPGQSLTNPYQGVLAIFVGNVLRNEPITIYGTGAQTRDFIYIDDVVNAWSNVIRNKKSIGKILEVGTGKATSINMLAREIIHAAGRNERTYPIVHVKKRAGDIPGALANVRAIRNTLGSWRPMSLAKGLPETFVWAKIQK